MRLALQALTEELRRLKASGVKRVSVDEPTLVALRRALENSGPTSGAVASNRVSAAEPVATVAPKPASSAPVRVFPTVPAAPVANLPAAPEVKLPAGEKQERWAALEALVLNDPVCRANVRPGKKVVLGVGSLDARIMFVGEAPGAEEEIQGEPFVGPAGQLLTRMIQAMGLQRADVYIGNIMNWRPQLPVAGGGEQVGNRPPTEEEMRYCLPYLRAQIEVVKPALLVALGTTAAQGLLGFGAFKALGEIRGKWRDFEGRPLMVTYHPSYILRNQSNRSKRMIWEDLLQVMEKAGLPVSDRQRAFFLDR
jgi:uracil-DNA glycosylase family 4